MKKYLAEFVGTTVLTLMGCGAAVALDCNPTNVPGWSERQWRSVCR